MTDELLYERRDRIAIITINRPEKRNALNAPARAALFTAFRDAEADDKVRAVIVTGAGDKSFCSGADLTEMANNGTQLPGKDFTPILRKNVTLTKPTIAAVNGTAFAGGFLLAQMCDLCVAAEGAQFAITEAKWGRGAPWSTPLSTMIPQRIWHELLMTAAPISARRMYEVGFVNRVVPREALLDEAIALASTIVENAPLTIAAGLQAVYLAAEMGVTAAEVAADAVFAGVYASEDAQEGPLAFREKRQPMWKNR